MWAIVIKDPVVGGDPWNGTRYSGDSSTHVHREPPTFRSTT